MDEDDLDDKEDSQMEDEDQEQQTYFMGTQSQARNRLNLLGWDLCIKIGQISTGDSLHITIPIMIDRDQTKECKALFKEHKIHLQTHHKHQDHSHVVLGVDAQIVFK